MARYINVDALLERIDAIEPMNWTYSESEIQEVNDFNMYRGMVESSPTADITEVKHGEWKPIVKQDDYFEPPYCDTCKCSVCGYGIDVCESFYNYCPNCGAKMDGDKTAN